MELQRSVYIGLGGTGIKSILETKKQFIDTFGEIPPCIAFLGLDTNAGELESEIMFPHLEISEKIFLDIHMGGMFPNFYSHNSDSLKWIPEKNLGNLPRSYNTATSPIRSNGRLAFTINATKIENNIRDIIDRVSRATNDEKGKWELVNNRIQIYLVFSLSGGTGSGTFINMSMMLRELFGDQICIHAVAIGPGFFADHGTPCIYGNANAYGAMLDADYLMRSVSSERPFRYQTLNETRQFSEKLFDYFFLIDKNRAGLDLGNDYFYPIIGKALTVIPLTDTTVPHHIHEDAWVNGLGICEISINTRKLNYSYSLWAAQKIVSDMIGQCGNYRDVESARTWAEDNNICIHRIDHLLDSFYDLNQIPDFTINSNRVNGATAESESYVADAIGHANMIINENLATKLEIAKSHFFAHLSEITKGEGGLSEARRFIEELTQILQVSSRDIEDGINTSKERLSSIESWVTEIIDRWHPIFFSRSKSELSTAQYEYVKERIKRMRFEKVLQFLGELKIYINRFEHLVQEVLCRLENVNMRLKLKEAYCKSTFHNAKPFHIELTALSDDYQFDSQRTVTEFAKKLDGEDLLTLADISDEEIFTIITDFTASLKYADFKEMSLENAISKLSDSEIRRLFNKAFEEADILLEIEHNRERPEKKLYVFVPGGENGVIADLIKDFCHGHNTVFYDSPTKNSMFILSHESPIKATECKSICRCEREYFILSERHSFSIDSFIEKMLLKSDDNNLERTLLYSSVFHEELKWSLYSDGTLEISGTGKMPDYTNHWNSYFGENQAPWIGCEKYGIMPLRLRICNGITHVGANAFESFGCLKEVFLAESVQSLGQMAFFDCFNIKKINKPDGMDIEEFDKAELPLYYKGYTLNGNLLMSK